MRKLLVGVILLLAQASWAGDGRMHLMADADVATPAQRREHSSGLPFGDIHKEVLVTGDGVYADWHGPFPFDSTDANESFIIAFETDEIDTSKEFCLLITACAQVDNQGWANCVDIVPAGVDFVVNAISSGSGFNRRFITIDSNQLTVKRSGFLDDCTIGACKDTIVRYRVQSDFALPDCTNPSSHDMWIQDLIVHYHK